MSGTPRGGGLPPVGPGQYPPPASLAPGSAPPPHGPPPPHSIPPPPSLSTPDLPSFHTSPQYAPPSGGRDLSALPPYWREYDEANARAWLAAKAEEEKKHQEVQKTQRELYRLELRRTELEILRTSLDRGIPPVMVPIVFAVMGGEPLSSAALDWAQQLTANPAQRAQVQQVGLAASAPASRHDSGSASRRGSGLAMAYGAEPPPPPSQSTTVGPNPGPIFGPSLSHGPASVTTSIFGNSAPITAAVTRAPDSPIRMSLHEQQQQQQQQQEQQPRRQAMAASTRLAPPSLQPQIPSMSSHFGPTSQSSTTLPPPRPPQPQQQHQHQLPHHRQHQHQQSHQLPPPPLSHPLQTEHQPPHSPMVFHYWQPPSTQPNYFSPTTPSSGTESSRKRKAVDPPARAPSFTGETARSRSPPFASQSMLSSPPQGRTKGHMRQESDLSTYRSPAAGEFPDRRVPSPPGGVKSPSSRSRAETGSAPFPPPPAPASGGAGSSALGILNHFRNTATAALALSENTADSGLSRGAQQYRPIEPWPRQKEGPGGAPQQKQQQQTWAPQTQQPPSQGPQTQQSQSQQQRQSPRAASAHERKDTQMIETMSPSVAADYEEGV